MMKPALAIVCFLISYWDLCYGLRFLHSKTILHRNLKSFNVLLDDKLWAKLSDFGLSKVKSRTAYISTVSRGGTIAWMTPELFSLKPKYSPLSDVYAYGMTAWELASRELPYRGSSDAPTVNLTRFNQTCI